MKTLDLFVSVFGPRPPWYWRILGREYWSGWAVVLNDTKGNTGSSDPAPEPPTPRAVAWATVHAYERLKQNERENES